MSNSIFELSERKQSLRDMYEFNGRLFTLWETTNGGVVYIPVNGEKPEFYCPLFGDDVYALIVEPDNTLVIDKSKQYSIGDFKRVPPVDNTDGSPVKMVEDGLYTLNNWIFRARFDSDCMEWNLHETIDRAFFILRSNSDKKIYACGANFTGKPYQTPWTVDDLKPCDENGNPTEQKVKLDPAQVVSYPDYSREATFDGKISDYLEIVKVACDQADKLLEIKEVSRYEDAEPIYQVADLIGRLTYQASVVAGAYNRMVDLLGPLSGRAEALAMIHGTPLPEHDDFWFTPAHCTTRMRHQEDENLVPF